MNSGCTVADPHCQVESQWQPQGPPFALCMQTVEKHSTGNQAHKGLMTIAKQQGWEDGRLPFTTTYIVMNSADSIDAYLNSLQVTGKIITTKD